MKKCLKKGDKKAKQGNYNCIGHFHLHINSFHVDDWYDSEWRTLECLRSIAKIEEKRSKHGKCAVTHRMSYM